MTSPLHPSKTAIILLNLGTPDAPTPQATRRYLQAFLSDRRVIEMPKWLWQVILRLFVLTTRPKKVAHAYQSIWDNPKYGAGSPMRAILQKQVLAVQQALESHKIHHCTMDMAMTYGSPNIRHVLRQVLNNQAERVIVFPLYPQYSATSTGAAFDATMRTLMQMRNVPETIFIKDYHNHPKFIEALKQSVLDFWQNNNKPQKLLMSFHGIPQVYVDKGDPYFDQCQTTARLLAEALQLKNDEWAISFQSRFGAQKWISPYTDEILTQWGQQKIQSVHVISPAFSADCLETLEELAILNKHNFQNAGGGEYAYIPALNDMDIHIELLCDILRKYI